VTVAAPCRRERAASSYRHIVTVLHGKVVRLRPATAADVATLATIRATPEVRHRWGEHGDVTTELLDDLASADLHVFVIEYGQRIAGAIQWEAEEDPMYRHASIDLYVDPSLHGRGLGTDAVRTLARHLIEEHGHHRLVIDPATDNLAAIACYRRVGFRSVGVMRQYERSPDGTWHDGLLMELLAEELMD
jgi:aminoglycoside 6'-N-acetyltransferase